MSLLDYQGNIIQEITGWDSKDGHIMEVLWIIRFLCVYASTRGPRLVSYNLKHLQTTEYHGFWSIYHKIYPWKLANYIYCCIINIEVHANDFDPVIIWAFSALY